MTKQDYLDLKELLSKPKNIVLVPHKNADGDAPATARSMSLS